MLQSVFYVAHELGMTVGEMEERMSYAEFEHWLSYFKWKSEEERKQIERSKRKKGR